MARRELTPQEIQMRKIISSNLISLAEQNHITQTEISEKLDIPKSTINGYFNGTSVPNSGNVQKLADYFNVQKSDIDPRFKTLPTNLIPIKQTKLIPVIGTIACGSPIFAEQNVIDTVAFPVELLPSGEVFFLKANGDSMEPDIKDGSYVMIRKQEDVENGEIAAVLLNGDEDSTLKRVRKMGNTILLEAINDSYEPYLVNEDNPARIIGKAVKVLNDL